MDFNKKLTLSTKLTVGKYKEKTIFEIFKLDPSYIEWLVSQWKGEIDYKVKDWLANLNP
jgi:hypothetical protein